MSPESQGGDRPRRDEDAQGNSRDTGSGNPGGQGGDSHGDRARDDHSSRHDPGRAPRGGHPRHTDRRSGWARRGPRGAGRGNGAWDWARRSSGRAEGFRERPGGDRGVVGRHGKGKPRAQNWRHDRSRRGPHGRETGRGERTASPAGTTRPPELPEGVSASDLHKEILAELRVLARPVADAVARRLVATAQLLDEDPAQALAHALVARRLASRIAVVREAVGLAAYRAGEWQTALSELRTYHRLSGRQTHLALVADCERALGRPERAIDIYRGADHTKLDKAAAIELLIVTAGARRDMGQPEAAVAMLQVDELTQAESAPWVARLRYAYADALLAVGRRAEAREWFSRAVEADEEGQTDAVDRLLELDGVVLETDESTDEELATPDEPDQPDLPDDDRTAR